MNCWAAGFLFEFECYFTGQALERALIKINREDVVKKCIYNVENVEDEMEAAAARVAMDQSGNYWLLWLQIYIKPSNVAKVLSVKLAFIANDLNCWKSVTLYIYIFSIIIFRKKYAVYKTSQQPWMLFWSFIDSLM